MPPETATVSDPVENAAAAPSPESARRRAAAAYPETWQYRLKNRLLGPPMVSEQLQSERLSNPVALGVLAPDMISSSAYGTEEMLAVMVPVIGVAAFSMVIPVTIAIIVVLFFVTLSYLQVISVYDRIGGSYVVARDNFGPYVAQIAAVALLIDYIVTVAVQTSAGTAALTSAYPSLIPWTVPITVAVTLLMLYGNLRGIREAGKFFAFPMYFFVVSLGFVIIVGYFRAIFGGLPANPLPSESALGWGHIGSPGNDLLMGLGLFYCLQAFANGGASLTGLEAVSDGISTFRKPTSRNGRKTLIAMCCILGFLVIGTTFLAHLTHAVPYEAGTPTVVSQEVRSVLGSGALGSTLFYVVQFATMLILFTGGNTSFNGFPYLASFVAGDSFLPRQMTKRGHRLAFSNGIFVLASVAIVLIIVFQAKVNSLIALYAVGVFTGFTLAGAGMTKHNLRERGTHWKRWMVANAFSCVLSLSVVVILFITKFGEGAWIVAVVAPPMYIGLLRLHRQYVIEAEQLETGVAAAVEAAVLRRHVVVVLIDRLDMASARAIQYARALRPDELRAVHFNIDAEATVTLSHEWSRLGLARLPLDVVECRDRRLDRAALEYAAEVTSDGATECSMLLPRRVFQSRWQRVLHDRTAERISDAVETVDHVSATIIPFNVSAARKPRSGVRVMPARREPRAKPERMVDVDKALATLATDRVQICDVAFRQRSQVAGRIRQLRVQTAKGTTNLECVITDDTGDLLLVFQGRPQIPGIEPGARLVASGMVGLWKRQLAILNPDYELVGGHRE